MTAAKIIEIVDRSEPNMIEAGKKLKWLNDLDHKTFMDLCPASLHKDWKEYGPEDLDKELFIPDPYAQDCYEAYLRSKIAAEFMEMARYNQFAAMFNGAYQEYLNWHNRRFARPDRNNRFKF